MESVSAASRHALRATLIEAAARLIATEGTAALTLRRVAREVGTSTMAVYTHFGGMPELRRALRREGWARFAARIASDVTESDDPVADLVQLGRAYYENAVANPDLYRVMFMEQPLDETDAETGAETRDVLVRAMRRCIEASRFDSADPEDLAREYWALGHGTIALQLAQLMSVKEARRAAASAMLKLFRAYGDDPDATAHSLERALGAPAPSAVPLL